MDELYAPGVSESILECTTVRGCRVCGGGGVECAGGGVCVGGGGGVCVGGV